MPDIKDIQQFGDDLLNSLRLVEYNDHVTRKMIVDTLLDYMKDEQDFVVVCDETNNPPEVIDQHCLYADVYLKRDQIYKLSFTVTPEKSD